MIAWTQVPGGRGRLYVALALLGLAISSLTACTSSSPSATSGDVAAGRVSRMVADYGRDKLTEFERKILADNVVDAGEYSEANAKFSSCVRSLGLSETGSLDSFGVYKVSVGVPFEGATAPAPGSAEAKAFDVRAQQANKQCAAGISLLVGMIYEEQIFNPQNKDFTDGTVACLVATKKPPAGFDRQAFDQWSGNGQSGYGLTVEDPAVLECLNNPFGVRPTR